MQHGVCAFKIRIDHNATESVAIMIRIDHNATVSVGAIMSMTCGP